MTEKLACAFERCARPGYTLQPNHFPIYLRIDGRLRGGQCPRRSSAAIPQRVFPAPRRWDSLSGMVRARARHPMKDEADRRFPHKIPISGHRSWSQPDSDARVVPRASAGARLGLSRPHRPPEQWRRTPSLRAGTSSRQPTPRRSGSGGCSGSTRTLQMLNPERLY
jgi:hypothetical protein